MAVKAVKTTKRSSEEEARLQELYEYEILDTPDEIHFDEIVKTAASFFDVPIALISLVDEDRQWFKAKVGVEASETPRDIAFCSHTIEQDGVLVVPDARLDLRFSKNPFVKGDPNIRFYAGAPLITSKHFRLGTLCLVDLKPRQLSNAQIEMLALLSKQIIKQLELKKMGRELRVKNRELEIAHADLQKTSQFLTHLTDNLPIGVFCKDVKNGLAYNLWNKKMEEHSGKSSQDMINRTSYDLFPKEQAEIFQQQDKKLIQEGIAVDRFPEMDHFSQKGLAFHRTLVVPLKDEKNEVQYILGISEDITAQKESQAQLIQASKMSSLGEMAAGIAHEINNPLAVIRAKSQILSEMFEKNRVTPEAVEACAQKINETTVRISKIISGLRNFAREGSQDPVRKTALYEIMESVRELCFHNMKNKGVSLEISKFEMKLQLECRGVQIVQVLVNLLNNSLDAVRELPEKWIRIDVKDFEDDFEISVTDSGLGISSEVQEKMMVPFYTTKEVGKGTGLGLSISKGIIESHHGRILYDKQNPNTCFVIRFPKRQAAPK